MSYIHRGAFACSLVIQRACAYAAVLTVTQANGSLPSFFFSIQFRGGVVELFFRPALLALADWNLQICPLDLIVYGKCIARFVSGMPNGAL